MSHAPAVAAEHVVRADPKHCKVEFENDKVRVLRISYGPNEKSIMHSHAPGAVISLSDQQVRFRFPNGTSEEKHMTTGQAGWVDATTHLPENLRSEPLELIYVEVK